MRKFTFYKQQDRMDCGPTCLRMIAKHCGRDYPIENLREICQINKSGCNLLGISEAAEQIGFTTLGVKLSLEQLKTTDLPCILHWRQNHFVVLYKIKKGIFYVADPSTGLIKFSESEFIQQWSTHHKQHNGTSLMLGTTPRFFEADTQKQKINWSTILVYFLKYKQLFGQLVLGLGIGTVISLIAPLLTQTLVDTGISSRNMSFVSLILIAQVALFIGSSSINFLRSWILLHISSRINISFLTDFITKLMKLPISFFETKTTGDIMQRMNDHRRIESFLTGTTLNSFFSLINLVIYTVALVYYNKLIFLISLVGTTLYVIWIALFLKKRRDLNLKQFDLSASNQDALMELLNGVQDIKLNNCKRQKRWNWEYQQANLYRFKIQNLTLSQYQEAGSLFIHQAKNIVITFFSVKAVIDGSTTIGGMMAIQFLVGQFNAPVQQLLGFIQNYQDSKMSIERLNEIDQLKDEDDTYDNPIAELPADKSLLLQNVTFKYPGAGNYPVLDKLSLIIPEGKVTAIVGSSGSGKTTIIKLLLRFFEVQHGEIKIGNTELKHFDHSFWRSLCGTVMQDGYIFSDTVLGNIILGDEVPDEDRLLTAIRVANIQEFINDLPFGLETKIGVNGNGISQGQRQRLLIARVIYKNPYYLFFDEATNALDSKNESSIMSSLKEFCVNRTVVVIAHRLSTVTNADNIIVLDKGKIVEQGPHIDLLAMKSSYYELVRNQLQLES